VLVAQFNKITTSPLEPPLLLWWVPVAQRQRLAAHRESALLPLPLAVVAVTRKLAVVPCPAVLVAVVPLTQQTGLQA
jgi:hypothetical protein